MNDEEKTEIRIENVVESVQLESLEGDVRIYPGQSVRLDYDGTMYEASVAFLWSYETRGKGALFIYEDGHPVDISVADMEEMVTNGKLLLKW